MGGAMIKAVLDRFIRTLHPFRKDQEPHEWRNSTEYRYWRRFLASAQYWPFPKIEQWRLRQLKLQVTQAYQNTNGYRDLYDAAGVKPDDITKLSDIRFLPFTDKTLIRDNIEDFSVTDPARCYMTTSGSTGVPFGFYYPRGLDAVESAFVTSGWARAGWKGNMCKAVLRGNFVGDEKEPIAFDPERNELLLSSFFLSSALFEKYVDAVKQYRTKALFAYPSSLHIFCDLLKETDKTGEISFDIILIASENIYDWLLEKTREIFPKAKIFAWYGQTEMTVLAGWCEHSKKYHVCPFYGYTEFINPDDVEAETGQESEIVGTDFHNRITPFIRYRTGDFAVKGKRGCPDCGRQYRLMERIIGRSHEAVVTKKGDYVAMAYFTGIHGDLFDNVRQFRFYQDTPGVVVFRMVPKAAFRERDELHIRQELQRRLGNDIDLKIELTDDIPRSSGGKYNYLEQKLPVRYHEKRSD